METNDATRVNYIKALPDNMSGRSTPSNTQATHVEFGYMMLLNIVGIPDKIRDSTACLETYVSGMTPLEKGIIDNRLKSGDVSDCVDIMCKAVSSHALKRFFDSIPGYERGADQDTVIINDGIEGLNNWVGDRPGCQYFALADVNKDLQRVSPSILTDLTVPVLERLGMTTKVAQHIQDNRDRLLNLADCVTSGNMAARSRFIGAPLFVAIAMAYQMYDNVDIAIYGDYVLFYPKGKQADTSSDLQENLGFESRPLVIEVGTVLDGLHCVKKEDDKLVFLVQASEVVSVKRELFNTLQASEGVPDQRHQELVQLKRAKQLTMKLLYYAWASNKDVKAYNGLNAMMQIVPTEDVLPGFSMREAPTESWCNVYQSHIHEPEINEAFGDTRAYIGSVGVIMRKLHRRARLLGESNQVQEAINKDKSLVSNLHAGWSDRGADQRPWTNQNYANETSWGDTVG